ncbi:MAG: beta-propeller domain-containing protein [Verrucomicrobiota bacterium]
MKSNTLHLWHQLCLLLTAVVFIGTTGPLAAASGGRKILALELSADRLTANVTVPAGVESVTVQRFQRDGGWQKVRTKTAVAGVMKFKLPAAGPEIRWRAIGQVVRGTVSHDKFPATFYKGKSRFDAVKSGSRIGAPGILLKDMTGGEGGNLSAPEEADIWKVDGDTVYFFNQLRGLQVLDLADPADPRITASLRLPAVGQDLYLLPGSSKARTVVLLTEGWSNHGGSWTRINLVKVNAGKAEITSTQDVPGSLADSRLAGNRLILATTEWNDYYNATDWSSRSRLSEWLLAADSVPQAAGETLVEGDGPLIASGPDWLALAVNPNGRWDVSDVTVFAIRPNGLIRMARPFRTAGAVTGKFAMQWSGNVLTTISEKNMDESGWSPTTILENFRVWAPEVVRPAVIDPAGDRLGRLKLAKGESLFATRFAGDKAYVVTFLQTDPLFVIDLSDPKDPVVAGHLEVPGWSSHLEPLGDLLFAVGWESETVAASIFDVSNPASPKLLRRVSLGTPGTYSEALWDEQALKVLPHAGLAMIPLSTYDGKTGQSTSVVQLLDIDLTARDLRLRGKISHAFDARRADLIGETVVSISQRVLVAAGVADRDAPAVLSEVTLAWPVDRVLEANGHLLQIEDGGWYGGGGATVRVSPADAPEQILAETDLGEGTVRAADLRDGKLFILREIASTQSVLYWSPVTGKSGANKLALDIYDCQSALAPVLLGSCSLKSGSGAQLAVDHLLWPQPNRPAVVLDYRMSYWYGWDKRQMTDPVVTLSAAARPLKVGIDFQPYGVPEKAPRLILFDTTLPNAPEVGEPVDLGAAGLSLNGVGEAADGRIVIGTYRLNDADFGKAFQSARVVEVESSGLPVIRPLIDLPGELIAVSELDRKGFLAFTQVSGDRSTTLQASACDGFEAFLIDSFHAPAYAAATAGGRRVFVATKAGVERKILGEDGSFHSEPMLDVGYTPDSLRCVGGILIGAKWNALFAADVDGDSVKKWRFPAWNLGLERVIPASNGDLLVPFGDYGAERLKR